MNHPPSAHMRPSSGTGKGRLKDLLAQPDNRVCADCGAPDPKWASSNIGVLICLKCSGVHRSLGAHISKVLSVTLDEWSDDQVDSMIEVGGNASANSIYEAYLPQGVSKPGPEAGSEERSKYIRSKYELQEFLKPSLRIPSNSSKNSSQSKISDGSRNSASSEQSEGMVAYIGMLKVRVLKATNLAVRDVVSSDPYVVLKLGKQRVKTAVATSNLNPVWNEELMLSVPEDYGPVKLEIYDYDALSADDVMGEAEIDVQSMITSATGFGNVGKLENMQIGKWLKSNDNALLEDSTVNIVDGKVKQSVSLKLQKVESGEIHLDLEWIPLDQ